VHTAKVAALALAASVTMVVRVALLVLAAAVAQTRLARPGLALRAALAARENLTASRVQR